MTFFRSLAQWFNNLPSPVRHAIISGLVLEAGVAVNTFAGVASYHDIVAAAAVLPLALVIGLVRFLQQFIAGPTPAPAPTPPPGPA